jgi:hypothetical protein
VSQEEAAPAGVVGRLDRGKGRYDTLFLDQAGGGKLRLSQFETESF